MELAPEDVVVESFRNDDEEEFHSISQSEEKRAHPAPYQSYNFDKIKSCHKRIKSMNETNVHSLPAKHVSELTMKEVENMKPELGASTYLLR